MSTSDPTSAKRAAQSRVAHPRSWIVWLVVLVGVGMSAAVLIILQTRENLHAVERFKRDAQERLTSIEHVFSKSTETLIALEAFYGASHEVERKEFKLFSQTMLKTYPFVESVEWLPRVPARGRDEFERELRSVLGVDAAIQELRGKRELVPASAREEYFPVLFTEPYQRNRVALGFDHSSIPKRGEVMGHARDTGQIVASDRVTLFRVAGEVQPKRHDIILFMPIYRNGAPHDTLKQRRENLQGFVASIVLLDGLVSSAFATFSPAEIDVFLYEFPKTGPPKLLYGSALRGRRRVQGSLPQLRQAAPGGVYHEHAFMLAGKRYVAVGVPTRLYFSHELASWPTVIFLGGLLVTAVVGIYLHRVVSESVHVEQLVLKRTSQLTRANEALQQIAREHKIAEDAANKRAKELRVRSRMVLSVTQDLERERAKLLQEAQERRKVEARFQRVVEASPTALVMVNRQGAIRLVNSEAERLFGYDRAELLGRSIDVLVPRRYREEHPRYRRGFFANPEARAMGSGRDLYGLRKDGSEFPVEIGLSPIETAEGPAVLSAIADITERKSAQQRLTQYANDLKRSNEELDQFAYVASHDLKAPLRGIDNVSQWIVEDLGDAVPDQTRGHLEKMRQRVERMEKLLDDLLAYSRAGRVKGEVAEVDINDLVRDVTHLLALPEGFSVETVGPLPTVRAYHTPLELVFRNLIHNAVKHHDRAQGRVEVSARRRGRFVEFLVCDDGPGIDRKYHERIFGMFKTLKPRDQVEASGMGLAVVKKTVESQGGFIQVESHRERGACFRFTWPQSVQDKDQKP